MVIMIERFIILFLIIFLVGLNPVRNYSQIDEISRIEYDTSQSENSKTTYDVKNKLKRLLELVKSDSSNIQLLIKIGDYHRANLRHDIALEYYSSAFQISQNDMRVNWGLATSYFYLEKLNRAKHHFRICFLENYNINQTLDFLGKIEFYSSNYLASKKYFNMLLSIDSNSVEALTNLALISQHDNNYQEAEKYLLRALKLNKRDFIAHLNIGVFFLSIGENERSRIHLKSAIDLKPDDKRGYKALAQNYLLSKLFSLAEQYFEAALKLDPRDKDALFNLLILYTEISEYKKALHIIDKYNSLNINHEQMNIAISNLYTTLEDYKQALFYAKKQVEDYPDDIEGYALLMGLYELLKMEKEYEEINKYAENNFEISDSLRQ